MNPERVSELLETHGARIWNECLRVSQQNRAEAEDLFQEVWVRLLHAIRRKSADAPDAEWILGLMRNVAREQLRAEGRRSRRIARYASRMQMGTNQASPAFPLSHWVRDSIEAGLAALTPRRREVVRLRLMEGLSTQETAARMRVAPGTVKATLHAGRRDLAVRFQPLWDLLQRDDL